MVVGRLDLGDPADRCMYPRNRCLNWSTVDLDRGSLGFLWSFVGRSNFGCINLIGI